MKDIIKRIVQYFIPSFRPQVANEEQRRLGICVNYRVPTDSPLVALTFDDGPSEGADMDYLRSIQAEEVYDPGCTRAVLEVLEKHQAKATFFVCGEHITREAESTIQGMHESGHEVAVHCWKHGQSVHLMPQPELIDELDRTAELITRITGTRPTCMRPPRGETEAVTTQLIFSHTGLRTILWQETAFDWLFYTPEKSCECILSTIAPGSIVLLHDIYRYTPETVDVLLTELSKRGLKCTTVSDLLNHSRNKDAYMAIPHR